MRGDASCPSEVLNEEDMSVCVLLIFFVMWYFPLCFRLQPTVDRVELLVYRNISEPNWPQQLRKIKNAKRVKVTKSQQVGVPASCAV